MAGLGWLEVAGLGWLVFTLLYYVVLGVWIYRDARARDRSGCGWLAGWLLLGPFALLVWLRVRDRA